MRTRYSWALGSDTYKDSFHCIALAEGISKEFLGNTYIYLSDFYADKNVQKAYEFYKYFVPEAVQLRRRGEKPYLEAAIKITASGHAIPSISSDSTERERLKNLSKEKRVAVVAEKIYDAVIPWPATWEAIPETVEIFDLKIGVVATPVPLVYAKNGNSIPSTVFGNVIDDIENKIQLVIREKRLAYMSVQEQIIHYIMGTCPPMYFHIDEMNWNDVDAIDYMKNNMPGPPLREFIYQSHRTDNKPKFNDFRFLKTHAISINREQVGLYIGKTFIDLPHLWQERIIDAAIPQIDPGKRSSVIEAIKIARSRSLQEIQNIGNIAQQKIIYGSMPIPDRFDVEKLSEFIETTDEKDFETEIGFSQAIKTFAISEGIPATTIDMIGEIIMFGSYVMPKNLKWSHIARLFGKDFTIELIKKATEVFKERRRKAIELN